MSSSSASGSIRKARQSDARPQHLASLLGVPDERTDPQPKAAPAPAATAAYTGAAMRARQWERG